METGKMEKAAPSAAPRAPKSGPREGVKPDGVRRKKAAKSKLNIALDRREVAKMIEQIREEIEFHHGCAKEVKTKLDKLIGTAFSELLKVKELKGIIVSLRENGQENTAAGPPAPPGGENSPAPAPHPKDQWRAELDRELEKLLVIKKLLEASLPPADAKPEAPAARSDPNGVKNILVVDDDLTTVKIISHFLQKENYRVRTSLSGMDGLKRAFQETPDLILLDVMMPDLNGFQFLSIYRKDKENSRVPVVILSSLSEEADVLKGLEIGAMDYITKPFSPQVLMAKIKKNLSSGP